MAANTKVIRNYYILPCCLLLLNLVNGIVSYKAGIIADPLLRTGAVILLVLFGSSITAFAVAPAVNAGINWLHQSSKRKGGGLGELAFAVILGVIVFWLYYRVSRHGIVAIVPQAWRN